MAGIGFELKKVFDKHTITSSVKGFSYAIFVISGPMIISLVMIGAIMQMLRLAEVPMAERSLFGSIIMYSYIFSAITASGFSMVISRYTADKLYVKDSSDILASLLGIIALCCAAGAVVGGVFYSLSPLPFVIKLLSYLVFIELTIINVMMVYISAVRDYKKVTLSFGVGLAAAYLFSVIFIALKVEVLTAVLAGIAMGFLMNCLFLITVVKGFFQELSDRTFGFLHHLKKMPLLLLTNFLFTVGLFGHNIVMWLWSDISASTMDTYLYAPSYDTATFYAIFTIIPALIVFVVRVETSFDEKYKNFGNTVVNRGTLRDIENARKKMASVLRNELTYVFEVQLIITLVSVLIGANLILPLFEDNPQTILLFVDLAVGYFLTYMTFFVITVLLYFDNQEDAFKTALLFLATTVAFTYLTIKLGPVFYGLGLGAGALISMLAGGYLLSKTLEDAVFRMFTKHTHFEFKLRR
ncbi:exopolysaccharide Pel transporter PelG [Anaerotalea alkaliphila]|nr:exopolysaccharide Pel transporter PelG [Anaerotalea alkaliphila]